MFIYNPFPFKWRYKQVTGAPFHPTYGGPISPHVQQVFRGPTCMGNAAIGPSIDGILSKLSLGKSDIIICFSVSKSVSWRKNTVILQVVFFKYVLFSTLFWGRFPWWFGSIDPPASKMQQAMENFKIL